MRTADISRLSRPIPVLIVACALLPVTYGYTSLQLILYAIITADLYLLIRQEPREPIQEATQSMSDDNSDKATTREMTYAQIASSRLPDELILHHDFNNPEALSQLKQQLAPKMGRLTLPPPVPKPAGDIDVDAAERYINRINSEDLQAFARKFILKENRLQCYSYTDFVKRFEMCMQRVCEHLKRHQLHNTHTILANDERHSQQWVASHAIQYLSFVPDRITRAFRQRQHIESLDLQEDHPEGVTLMLFDDWSISGTQLNDHLDRLLRIYLDNQCSYPLHIILAPVLMTSYAFERISKRFENLLERREYQNIKPILITSQLIPSMADIPLSNEDKQLLHTLCFNGLPNNQSLFKSRVCAYADWKIPDTFSAPHHLMNGTHASLNDKYYRCQISDIPEEAKPPHTRFVPDVTPVYRKF